MLSDIEGLEIFLSLYATGSVQKTAAELGIEKSTVSRKITHLENQLGRRLFDRSKRPFDILKDAQAIYPSVRRILEEKHHIEQYYKRLHNEDEMIIRVMLGNSQINFAPKFIAEYSDKFPKLHFNMISPTDVNDFLAGQADIVNLSGQAILSDCVLLPRGRMIFIPVASPSYVAKHGQVTHPSELSRHRIYSNLYPNRFSLNINFKLCKNGVSLPVEARDVIRFNNVEMTYRSILDGSGIGLCIPLFMCIDDLENGRLVPVLNGWHRMSHQNYVACKKDDWKIRPIRMFANWWAKKLTEYEKECEQRLVKLYDRQFYLNLLH